MILKELVNYYEQLQRLDEKDEIPKRGYSTANVAFSLNISLDGRLLDILPETHEEKRGKKTVKVSKTMTVPEQPPRSGQAPPPYFLCDNATFFLGIPKKSTMKNEEQRLTDQKKLDQKALKYFEKCKDLHISLLKNMDSPAAASVVRFFEQWQPEDAETNEVLGAYLDQLESANLVFRIDGGIFAQNDVAINGMWQNHIKKGTGAPVMQCLVSGKDEPIARIHPKIKGVPGAQSAGASLVGFNDNAFKSYGKDQSYNAPVSEYAAFAYCTALNHLIKDRKTHSQIGDTTLVYWAETGEETYPDVFGNVLETPPDAETQIKGIFKKIEEGKPLDVEGIQLDTKFFILGLSPNAARLSVRFFLQNTFGYFLKNLDKHQRRLAIVKPSYEENQCLSTWRLLNETVNQKSRDKTPSSQMAGAVTRAILQNTLYPVSLYNGVMIRIRAEQGNSKISWRRAAIIKAYLLKKYENSNQVIKGSLRMSLNEETNDKPYVLGRLFAILEDVQETASPGIKATIRDRYFNAACATPAVVFPTLLKLYSSHIKKIGINRKGVQINFQKQIGAIMDKLELENNEAFPKRLSLDEQGAFQLGYYHQIQKRFEKKDKGEEK